jgi:hypothetical protein
MFVIPLVPVEINAAASITTTKKARRRRRHSKLTLVPLAPLAPTIVQLFTYTFPFSMHVRFKLQLNWSTLNTLIPGRRP